MLQMLCLLLISMETTTDIRSTIKLMHREFFSTVKLSFHTATTTGYGFSTVMDKSLHTILIKICTSRCDPLFFTNITVVEMDYPLPNCLVSVNIQQTLIDVNVCSFFCVE